MKCRKYTVKHLDDCRKGHDTNAWLDKGHTITILSPDDNDLSRDELYIDHHHIHSKNWKYVYNRNQLVWKQDSQINQSKYLAGQIYFEDGQEEGAGSMQFSDERQTVHLSYLHPSYTCDISSDAGAYVATDGLTLKWDTSSDKWKNAKWEEKAITFTYWIEKSIKVGDQQLYQTAIVFKDNKANKTWDVEPRGPGDSGAFSSNLSSTGQFTFSLNSGVKPEDGEYFPYRMAFQFTDLAQAITGGAILCKEDSTKGTVYAMHGKINNPLITGTYSLMSVDGDDKGSLDTHSGKLVINGKKVASSGTTGNKLWWEGVDSACIPPKGFADFSPDGSKVIASSFGAIGSRSNAALVTDDSSTLQFQDLLNMNPFGNDDKGNTVDKVQQAAMEGFYKFIQFYMPKDYLHNFIAPNPPDLGPLEDIAKDNADNQTFYSSLAVPYLTNALSRDNHKDVGKLNARRADKKLKQGISTSDVYKRHAAKLYSYEWQQKFPLMTQFIVDQQVNASTHNEAIDADVAKWKKELKQGIDQSTDKDEKEQLQQMLAIADDAGNAGKAGKYWAYIMFRYLTSPAYLTALQMILQNGNNSQILSQDIMRYSSVLSILDPSGHFTEQFVNVVNIFQLAGVLPTLLDFGGNLKEFNFFMKLILEAFIKKYINSQDPQMSNEAKIVAEELKVHSLQDYLDIFNATAGTTQSWSDLAQTFQNRAIKFFGKVGGVVARMLAMSGVVFGIVLLAKGVISWDELTDGQKTKFILASVNTLVFLLRKGVEVYAAKVAGGWWEAFKVFFYKDLSVASDTLNSTFGKWLIRNASAPGLSETAIAMEKAADVEFEEAFPRVTKIFGRNLSEFMATRFAAAMSIIGIVLSSISLHNSTSSLDKAMNALFLTSSILDLVAAVSSWTIAAGTEVVPVTIAGTIVGEISLAAIASLATGLAIAAAIGGIVIMIILMSKHHDPPDPVEDFIKSDAVKNAGLYMSYDTAVDYFEVIKDKVGNSRDIGVAISPASRNPPLFLHISPDGSLSLSGITYAYSTVLSLDTDENGQCTFFTKVWNAKKQAKILCLTLDDNRSLKMAETINDKDKINQQKWVVTCKGNVRKVDNGILESGNFTIYNVHRGRSYYLNVTGTSVNVGSQAQEWNFSMQGMKPEELSFNNIALSTFDKDRKFYPYLLQAGSTSGQSWSVSPTLPNWLELSTKTGVISQKSGVAPPKYPETSYTITAQNAYGTTSANFSITVISTV